MTWDDEPSVWLILANRLAEIQRERAKIAYEAEPLETLVFDEHDQATLA
jgi:hypothetical protein